MSDDPRSIEAYAQTLASLGGRLDGESLEIGGDPSTTLARAHDDRQLSVTSLPTLSIMDGLADQLRLQGLIGEGGMGQVFVAEQVSLQREVAVKCLRPGTTGRDALLREALVTGRLEHPGIVPVHLLAQTPEGQPLFVMKRVEGVTWQEALKKPRVVARLCGADDAQATLDFHLDVLERVASTMSFAHAKGVLHRDLKPENVMLGDYGEVYVMDWGLAVALGEDAVLPAASLERSVSGTPAYMPPEMAIGAGAELSERTDVFLLGSALFEVLAGRPPSEGKSIMGVLNMAFACLPPTLPDTVPEELATLCRTAMARESGHRFASVEAFRDALVRCRRHAGALALTRAADARAARLRALTEVDEEDGSTDDEAGSINDARVLFSECRFGYQQALAAWPEDALAQRGLRSVIELMLRVEISRKNLDAAATLLAELTSPPEEFIIAVSDLRRARAADAARALELERLAVDLDLGAEASFRASAATVTGLLWSGAAAAVAYANHAGWIVFDHAAATFFLVLFVVMMTGVQVALLRRSRINAIVRRLVVASVVGNVYMVLHWLAAWQLGTPLSDTVALYMLWVGGSWSISSALSDRRLLVTGLIFTVFGLLVVLWPQYMIELFAVAVVLGLQNVSFVWRRMLSNPEKAALREAQGPRFKGAP